ncbi:hypothetical protein CYMTET_23145 [Cymbomonas tetramitiformis]|uniref:Uncharacterized protein n=1 Tax=Cymbomonas tetramitiformis TaxID=36881 RepID=A0AAE0FYH7_9CHLO|nr:hypothetical protein CYMTET_23145 [Cymbomonas tetramitiformis]
MDAGPRVPTLRFESLPESTPTFATGSETCRVNSTYSESARRGSLTDRTDLTSSHFTLPRLHSAATAPDKGWRAHSSCLFSKHSMLDGGCDCMKRRIRAATGYMPDAQIVKDVVDVQKAAELPRTIGLAGGPPGLRFDVLRKADKIRSDAAAVDSLDRRVHMAMIDTQRSAREKFTSNEGLTPARVIKERAAWGKRYAKASKKVRKAKETYELTQEEQKREAWEKVELRLEEVSAGLHLKRQRQQTDRAVHTAMALAARLRTVLVALAAKRDQKREFSAALLIQRAYRAVFKKFRLARIAEKIQQLQEADKVERSVKIIQRTLRASIFDPDKKYEKQCEYAEVLLTFVEHVAKTNFMKRTVQRLMKATYAIQKAFKAFSVRSHARRRLMLVQWSRYERHQLMLKSYRNSNTQQLSSKNLSPQILYEMAMFKGASISRVSHSVKCLVIEAACQLRMQKLKKDTDVYIRKMEKLMPGWTSRMNSLEMKLALLPEMANMVRKKMEAMPKWQYELRPDELLGLQMVGQQMQEVVTHNAPIIGLELMSPQQMKVALCNLNMRVWRSAYLALSNERPASTSPNTTSSVTWAPGESGATTPRAPRESVATTPRAPRESSATTPRAPRESSVRVPRQSIMRTPRQSARDAPPAHEPMRAPRESRSPRSTPKEGSQREVKLLDPIKFPKASSNGLPKVKELSPRKASEAELNKFGVKNYDPMWANDLKSAILYGPPVVLATMPAKPEEKKVAANPPSPRKMMRKVAFKQKPLNNLVDVS